MSKIGKEIKRFKVNPAPLPEKVPETPTPEPVKEPEKCPAI